MTMWSEAKRHARRFVKRRFLNWRKSQTASPPKEKREWSIGIYTGASPLDLSAPEGLTNPVLTKDYVSDRDAAFVADPFMLRQDGSWFMFFEVLNRERGKGEIGLATSADGMKWTYEQIMLTEAFHLSYPYVFQWEGTCYMIPETFEAEAVRLYEATDFPTRWSFVGELLAGSLFIDSSVFQHQGKWWMFTETRPYPRWDTLRLYYADRLAGPWLEHPKSPVIEGNPHIARPAGRVVTHEDSVIRYAQDCFPTYGRLVNAFKVTALTTDQYAESKVGSSPVLAAGEETWNAGGMHNVDPHRLGEHQWIACVDGWRNL